MKKLILLLIFPLCLFSQNNPPKIGLVLSGGGAKGFAHIGVLKEIERAGIKLDYIGGTSMGAIVGGLYAAGYSANQIEKIVTDTDFFELLQDKLPRSSKPLFEKENAENSALTLPVFKGSIGLPQGFSKGQSVLNFLTMLLAPVDSITDFSKLPIPFYCIATNVENGEEVILNKGSLPLSLRASGSFPTLLHPIEINGKLLVDGGIANNFPVDIMRKKGIDIIIGVDVQGKLYKKEKLNSVVAILNQVVSYQMYNRSAKQIEDIDVYLHPNVYDYGVVDFEKGREILKKGTEVALTKRMVFDSIALLQKKNYKRKPLTYKDKKFNLLAINIKGNENYTRAYILGTLKLQVGDVLNHQKLAEKINNLTATDNFQRVDYRFTDATNGKILHLNLQEITTTAKIRLGIHYDLLYQSGVLINYTKKKAVLKNDVFSVDFIIGDNLRYNLDYFVDNGFYTSFGIKSRYNVLKANVNYNQNSQSRLNVKYRDFTNSVYIQTRFDRKFAVGFGLEHKNIFADSESVLTNNTIYDKSDYLNTFAYLKLDSYDKKVFMTKGFFADIGFKWFLASTDYHKNFHQFSQLKGKLGFATSFLNKFTFQYEAEAGTTLSTVVSQVFDFSVGGYNQNYINNFVSFYGYESGGLAAQAFLKSTFHFRYQVTGNHYAMFIANYARAKNDLFEKGQLFLNTKSGYALGYSLNSIIGPIELKYSWTPDLNQNYWLFNLGFWF